MSSSSSAPLVAPGPSITAAAITVERLSAFAPHCAASVVAPALEAAAARFEITTPSRVRHWLAQCAEETDGFVVDVEALGYSAPRLCAVWPERFRTLAAAAAYANSPRALANLIYAGRNGNDRPGDGWTFRGRGYVQLTGRANYAAAAVALDRPYVDEPDIVAEPLDAALTAAWFWAHAGLNAAADRDDLVAITRKLNGGLTSLAERRRQLVLASQVWPG